MNRRSIEHRALLVTLLVLTCVLVGLFAYDKSGRDDFWLAGACVAYGAVLGRLFWKVPEPDEEWLKETAPRRYDSWQAEPLPPPPSDREPLPYAPAEEIEPSEKATEKHPVIPPTEEWDQPTRSS
jgi:hypothetical protein